MSAEPMRIALGLLALGLSAAALAQNEGAAALDWQDLNPDIATVLSPAPAELSFAHWLQLVEQANRDMAAQKLNVPIAEAQRDSAGLRPDPQLSLGIDSRELARQSPGRKPPTTYTVGLTQTLELGGKRSARLDAARTGVALARANTDNFRLALRCAAALAYVEALRAAQTLAVQRESTAALERVAQINEEKRRHGAVSELVVVQTQVELQRARNELTAAESDHANALAALLHYVGDAYSGHAPPLLRGDLHQAPREYETRAAIDLALRLRPDVLAAEQSVTLAEQQVELARANRWVDVDVAANIRSTEAAPAYLDANGAPVTATPRSQLLGLTLSLPIPFSNLHSGDLRAALLARDQAQLQLDSVKRDVGVQVIAAVAAYSAARTRLQRYDAGIRDNARKVLDATLYSYERGGASLLELLEARRSDASTQVEYVQALADFASSWVQLEQALGRGEFSF